MPVWSVVAVIISLVIAAFFFGMAMYYKGIIASMTTVINSVTKGAKNDEHNQADQIRS